MEISPSWSPLKYDDAKRDAHQTTTSITRTPRCSQGLPIQEGWKRPLIGTDSPTKTIHSLFLGMNRIHKNREHRLARHNVCLRHGWIHPWYRQPMIHKSSCRRSPKSIDAPIVANSEEDYQWRPKTMSENGRHLWNPTRGGHHRTLTHHKIGHSALQEWLLASNNISTHIIESFFTSLALQTVSHAGYRSNTMT